MNKVVFAGLSVIAVCAGITWHCVWKAQQENLSALSAQVAEVEKVYLQNRQPAKWWLAESTTHQEVLHRSREIWRGRQLKGEALSHVGWVRASFQRPESSIAFHLGDPVDRNPWGTWDVRIAFYPGAEEALIDCMPGSLNMPGYELPPSISKAWLAGQLAEEHHRCKLGQASDKAEADAAVLGAMAFVATCPELRDRVRFAAGPTDMSSMSWMVGLSGLYESDLESMENTYGAGRLSREAAEYFYRQMVLAVGGTSIAAVKGSSRQKQIWRYQLWRYVISGEAKRGQTTPTPRVTDAGCSVNKQFL